MGLYLVAFISWLLDEIVNQTIEKKYGIKSTHHSIGKKHDRLNLLPGNEYI
jgi:hypothetical protein